MDAVESVELLDNPMRSSQMSRASQVVRRVSAAMVPLTEAEQESNEVLRKSSTEFACTFLQRIGFKGEVLAQYCAILREHGAGIADLPLLGFNGLQQIGIERPIDRTRILDATVNKEIRADPPVLDGQPVQVRVKFGIALLSNINTVEQTCTIKLFIDLYWNDPSMIDGDPKHVPTYIWRPDGYIYNSIGGGEKSREHELILSNPATGLLLRPLEFEVTLSNPMDLRSFPFDSDAVELIFLQSEDSSADEWVCVHDTDMPTCTKCFFDIDSLGEFNLKGYCVDVYNQMGGNGFMYAHAALHLHLVREPDYYLWKVVMPIFLTTLICFSSLLFDTGDLEARINTSATMFLTTMALLFVVSTDLPKTSFLTRIDLYLTGSMLVQLTVLLESCIVSGTLGHISESTANNMDNWMLWLFLPGYVATTILYFVPSYVRYRRIAAKTSESPLCLKGFDNGELQFYRFEVGKNVFY